MGLGYTGAYVLGLRWKALTMCPYLCMLCSSSLGHFQVGRYRYRSFTEGLYTL